MINECFGGIKNTKATIDMDVNNGEMLVVTSWSMAARKIPAKIIVEANVNPGVNFLTPFF